MRLYLLFHALFLFQGTVVQGTPEKEIPRKVRFLPLGDLPPFRQEIREGVRVELEPPAGSIPPREVGVGFGAEIAGATPLRVGQITQSLNAPSGAGTLILSKRDGPVDSAAWLKVNRPETGDFLVLLWRDPTTGTWENARAFVVPDDPVSAPAGSVGFINCSSSSVGIVIGNEKLILVPQKILRRSVQVGTEQNFEVVMPGPEGRTTRLYSGTLVQNPGERGLVMIYQADGVSARRPLKVTVRREPVPKKPKLEKDR